MSLATCWCVMAVRDIVPIEYVSARQLTVPLQAVLFDFDGTLSLIREGWQQVMVPLFVAELLRTPACPSHEETENIVRSFVSRLTGKQTIYQCIQLADQVAAMGGTPRDPIEYKHAYLALLNERIASRKAQLRGGADPAEWLVPGCREFLRLVQDRGMALYMASGTDLPDVVEEAELLDLSRYFTGTIYGALEKYTEFSKQLTLERILRERNIAGPELLVVGDGYVEIEVGHAVRASCLGIASLEAEPGALDPWKRTRLVEAGAGAIVADFRPLGEISEWIDGT